LGRHLAMLPLDPHLGKLLVMGAALGCLAPALVSHLGHLSHFGHGRSSEGRSDRLTRLWASY
jgi:HrpA-like RNA helicase